MKLRTYLRALLISSLLVTLFVSPASALEYDFDGADDYLFGKPTSQEVIHREEEDQNVNRSKTAARMPPGFGTPTSYIPNSGEYLPPNLAPGGMDGGLVNSLRNMDYSTLPSVDGSALPNLPDNSFSTSTWTGSGGVGYTDVTQDSYWTEPWAVCIFPLLALPPRSSRGRTARRWPRAWVTSPTPAFGMATSVWPRTTGEPTPISGKSIR